MRLLVVGSAGSIGTRRLTLLQEMGHTVVGVDPKENRFFSPELARQFEAVFICTPPQFATELAVECAKERVPFFLEKPGSINHREFLKITAITQNTDLVTMVACNLRYTTEYRAIQDALPNIGKPIFAYAECGYYLPFWRPGEYKTYYSCYRSVGGGVLMDSIHELDYIFSVFGFPISPKVLVSTHENTKELADLEAEDTANVYVVYTNGLNLVIHLDYLQRAYKRVFHVVGTKGRIDQTFNIQGSNEMYRREMQDFLQCVKHGKQTIKPVEQHLQILEFVDRIKTIPNATI